MRPVRNKIRVATKTPVKLYPNLKNVEQNKVQDPVQVFCRLRPNPNYETNICISLLSHTNLMLIPPDDLKNRKTVQYSFNHIFTEDVSQKEIFDDVAMPLMVGLMQGKNGLLFTYGVTGSGKTYTMTGESNSPGIIPRCITALYNTVGGRQTAKYIVKPDKMNGFDIQSESEAFEERILESKVKHRGIKKSSSDSGILNIDDCSTVIPNGNKSCLYAVFVTYIEIYNNIVYDLLDENAGSKSLQAKILREDSDHNVYVNGAVEIEVKTAEEAMDLYLLGKKRKRMAQTALNSESSRSHSIFTIRIVTVPIISHHLHGDQIVKDSNLLNIAQLSLVDLAGSERCSRTQTTGQRLKEAGRINNSLMSLRTCLEVLRDNQITGSSRIVPYREARLTHLFKNFFEGEGKVEMIVCVNPSARNYDEIVHVMKFAEITQEVKVLRPEIKETEIVIPKGPTTAVSISVQTDFDLTVFPNKISPCKYFPRARRIDPESDEVKSLIIYLKRKKQNVKDHRMAIYKLGDDFRMNLVKSEQFVNNIKHDLPGEKENVQDLKNTLMTLECKYDKLLEKSREKDELIHRLKRKLEDENTKYMLDKAKHKRKREEISEKISHELDSKLRRQREHIEAAMKENLEKIELVKDILSDKITPAVIKK